MNACCTAENYWTELNTDAYKFRDKISPTKQTSFIQVYPVRPASDFRLCAWNNMAYKAIERFQIGGLADNELITVSKSFCQQVPLTSPVGHRDQQHYVAYAVKTPYK